MIQHQVNGPVMHPLIAKLQGTDRPSIGRAEEVVGDVLADPGQFRPVFDAMLTPDPVVRMRAADAVEKITRRRADLLQDLEHRVLTEVAAVDQPEVRWHVAQLLPRLALTPPQRARATAVLRGFLDDDSRIVRTCAMQALADLAEHDEQMRRWVLPLLAELTRTGTPAMRSRGRKLLARLEQPGLTRPRLAEPGVA
jgi:HEAT repeat protein